jgi:hypothetical protein
MAVLIGKRGGCERELGKAHAQQGWPEAQELARAEACEVIILENK